MLVKAPTKTQKPIIINANKKKSDDTCTTRAGLCALTLFPLFIIGSAMGYAFGGSTLESALRGGFVATGMGLVAIFALKTNAWEWRDKAAGYLVNYCIKKISKPSESSQINVLVEPLNANQIVTVAMPPANLPVD